MDRRITMQIEIEKGIPMPKPKSGVSRGLTGTMRSMNVGDSIKIPESARTGVYSAAKNIQIKATSKNIGDGMLRVWRIA
jgi:hypothetical protein